MQDKLRQLSKETNYMKYILVIVLGLIIVIGSFLKVIGVIDFSSDVFWLVAGIGLTIESLIAYKKQQQFDRKYKIIEREEKK